MSLLHGPLSQCRHQHDIALTLVGAFGMIMGFVLGEGIVEGALSKEDEP